MSMHPSLGSAGKKRRHRSVLKRFERIKYLMEKDRWKEEDTVFGLPKLKLLKVKLKKEKAPEAAVAAAGATAEAVSAEAAVKPAEEKKTTGKVAEKKVK